MKVKKIQSDYIISIDSNDGKELKLRTNKPLHLDYAYATTVHSSQGLTYDLVIDRCRCKKLNCLPPKMFTMQQYPELETKGKVMAISLINVKK